MITEKQRHEGEEEAFRKAVTPTLRMLINMVIDLRLENHDLKEQLRDRK